MASCITAMWTGSVCPQVQLTVTESSSTNTTVTLAWTLKYITHGYVASTNGVGRDYTVKIDGATVKTGAYNINGKSTSTIATGTYTVSKTTAARSVSFSVSFAFNISWSGTYGGTKSASGSIGIAAKTSYTVKYNANGGSGAPSSQTKWHGTALTLSGTKPTRSGYTFQGWATSSGGSVAYSAGASYTENASVTLYAVWKAGTYTVSYNANGGSGAPSSQTKTYGVALTLSSTKPTRTNYTFKGWGTSASATTVAYAAGASYTSNASITLYAIWTLAYTKPRITSVSVSRCDSEGVESDEGTYALVKFNWACDKTVSAISVAWAIPSADGGSATIEASGTSGGVNSIVGGGALSSEHTYTVVITVKDASGSNSVTRTLAGTLFPIDVLAGGNGLGLGKPATMPGYVDSAFDMHFDNVKVIAGTDLEGNLKEAFQPQNQYGNTIVGYGNYAAKSGNTNVYGHDINFGVSNTANPGTFRPYRRQGDTLAFTLQSAGYVTNGGADVTFHVPLASPIIGSPAATAASDKGFILRQDAKYTHGSSATTYVTPSSYSVRVASLYGVFITAKFADTTNVVNNAPIGIYWSGTITFT